MSPTTTQATNECHRRGLNNTWKCTLGSGFVDSLPMVPVNGFYSMQCDRFLPFEGDGPLGPNVNDFRFSPYHFANKHNSPMSVWPYRQNSANAA